MVPIEELDELDVVPAVPSTVIPFIGSRAMIVEEHDDEGMDNSDDDDCGGSPRLVTTAAVVLPLLPLPLDAMVVDPSKTSSTLGQDPLDVDCDLLVSKSWPPIMNGG